MVSPWICRTPAYRTQSPATYSGHVKGGLVVAPLQSFGSAVAIPAVLHKQDNTHKKGNHNIYQHCQVTEQGWSFRD